MFSSSGTGDKSETAFYTVPALPAPGRYSVRTEGLFASAGAYAVGLNLRVNGILFNASREVPGQGAPHAAPPSGSFVLQLDPTIQELKLSAGDVLSYEIAIETAGVALQTYTWQVEFRLCRMPEDLL